jgi:diguanylate cyclase (GGDEF)-like protein
MESGAIVDTTGDARVDMRYDALELFAGEDDALLQLARGVLEKRESVVSESRESNGRYGSWIASRLAVAGELQGVLVFFSHTRRDQPFEEIDHDTLALMSALVGTALERRRTRSHLRTLAYYDALTGLPNRLLFQERLRDALVDSRGHATGLAVLFFDLDRFKDINDSLGHAMGDRFLQMVANRLARAVGEAGFVARMGGDEFIVLVRDCQSTEQVKDLADRLLYAIDQPYKLDGYEQFMTTSIGVSIYPNDGRDDQTLIKNADIAMYQAKDRGGNRHLLYNESFEAPLRTRLAQEKELRRAIERQDFILDFQPIIDVGTEQIVSVEALVRWNHPQRGTIFPDAFIPAAESSGLIVQLGEWVIANAARQVAAWNGSLSVCLAVNISARQFHQPDLCDRLLELLRESGLPPQSVEVEITESMALSDITHAIETVRKLKSIGTRIAVDDFGTGHSSLNYLRRFDVDHIKIDRSFVAGIGNELSDETIVKAIIAMGHSLGLTIVAEGVETRDQYDFLRAHGCDRVQGYYFSRPVDAGRLEQLLQGRGTPGEAG